MDVRQMLAFHQERRADCTVAAIPVPIDQARDFGIIEVDAEGRMIGFEEKPKDPKPMPGDPTRALASMGNYLFETDPLVREIVADASQPSHHDFGKNIIAGMFPRYRVFVYDFAQNAVPGQTEKERGYWRDVGTIDGYFKANMDLIEVDPIFSLYNERWPIFTLSYHLPPAKTVFADRASGRVGYATDSLVSEGVIISGGELHRCIVSPKVRVNSYSHVDECILFEGVNVGRHCRIRRAIIDKNVELPAGMTIGYNPEEDRQRFHVTEEGVVVIPKGMKL
jgi:glucose-1-phosphate adenylyltransferase